MIFGGGWALSSQRCTILILKKALLSLSDDCLDRGTASPTMPCRQAFCEHGAMTCRIRWRYAFRSIGSLLLVYVL